MKKSFTRCCIIAACLGATGAGWGETASGTTVALSPDEIAAIREKWNEDAHIPPDEPLERTLERLHEFWWSPLIHVPWDPESYVSRVLGLSEMERLMSIVRDGDAELQATLLAAANDWLDRYLYEYPLNSYVGDTDGLAGFSAHSPRMDVALTLIIAELDPSWESLERIGKAFDRHLEALHIHRERLGLPERPGDDGERRSQTTNVLGTAAVRLVEKAEQIGAAWLMENDALRESLLESVVRFKDDENKIADSIVVVDVVRSYQKNPEE